MNAVVQALLLLALPLLAIAMTKRIPFLDWLSPVMWSYFFGMVLGNLPALGLDPKLSSTFTEISVPLAIPLLLFSTEFTAWVRHARTAAFSFLLAVVSVMVMAFLGARIFASATDESWKVAGMLVGVYTGGTPNLLSIGLALDVRESTYILVNASDVVASGMYLLFLFTLAKPLLSRFLPPFPEASTAQPPAEDLLALGREPSSRRLLARDMGLGLLLSLLILGAGVGISQLVIGGLSVAIVILTITTLGIAASFWPRIRRLRGSYALGDYFILLFSVAIGTLTDFSSLVQSGSAIFALTATVVFGAVVLHYLLAGLFRIDVDTAIITSVAAVFGPAFIPPIAEVLKNRQVLLSGLTTGLVGYAVGNYLGLALAYWLRP